MTRISRRHFLYLSALAAFLYETPAYSEQSMEDNTVPLFPDTASVLQNAYRAELTAHKRYVRFCEKALNEGYPNIAYLFRAFSASEKIHANNYEGILNSLGKQIDPDREILFNVEDTKTNLRASAKSELEKIREDYLGFLTRLEKEGHDEAIMSCMYSWKSHKQHEKKINEIHRYAGVFFGSVANKIEDLRLDFYVCRVCGSTIDQAPVSPCDICNRSRSNYRRIEKPS